MLTSSAFLPAAAVASSIHAVWTKPDLLLRLRSPRSHLFRPTPAPAAEELPAQGFAIDLAAGHAAPQERRRSIHFGHIAMRGCKQRLPSGLQAQSARRSQALRPNRGRSHRSNALQADSDSVEDENWPPAGTRV